MSADLPRPPSAPGWFLITATGLLRYFDGQVWTDHTADPDPSLPAGPADWVPIPTEGVSRYFDGRHFTDLTRPLSQTAPGASAPAVEAFTPTSGGSTPRSPLSAAKRTGKAIGLVTAVAATLLVGAGVIGSVTSDDSVPDPATDDVAWAWDACKQWVTDELKAPATATFAEFDETKVTASGRRYTVRAYVDSENSFGANLRTGYTCIVDIAADRTANLVDLTYPD